MRKLTVLTAVLALGLTLGVNGTASAQKKHAPKGVWKAMLASLGDIQSISGALMVFDMDRATAIADDLVARETGISRIESLPKPVRDGHAKVADAARELAAATRSGEEDVISARIGDVLAACSACHYDLRDKKRREKMK